MFSPASTLCLKKISNLLGFHLTLSTSHSPTGGYDSTLLIHRITSSHSLNSCQLMNNMWIDINNNLGFCRATDLVTVRLWGNIDTNVITRFEHFHPLDYSFIGQSLRQLTTLAEGSRCPFLGTPLVHKSVCARIFQSASYQKFQAGHPRHDASSPRKIQLDRPHTIPV